MIVSNLKQPNKSGDKSGVIYTCNIALGLMQTLQLHELYVVQYIGAKGNNRSIIQVVFSGKQLSRAQLSIAPFHTQEGIGLGSRSE